MEKPTHFAHSELHIQMLDVLDSILETASEHIAGQCLDRAIHFADSYFLGAKSSHGWQVELLAGEIFEQSQEQGFGLLRALVAPACPAIGPV